MEAKVVYTAESVQISHVTLTQGESCDWHVHYRKCDGFLVCRGVLMVVADNLTPQYVRADTGAMTIPAGMPHRWVAMSDVEALQFYRARPDETLDLHDHMQLAESDVDRDS